MAALNYRSPVDAHGNYLPWLQDLAKSSGVYIIRWKATGTIMYVGESHTGRLAKTIKRHFYDWRDNPKRKHHTYEAARVEVAIRSTPPKSAVPAQNNLILKLEPRDNGYVPPENEAF